MSKPQTLQTTTAYRSAARRVSGMDHPIEFTVSGYRLSLSGRQVLEQAREALARGVPPEALRHQGWVVDIDGQPVGVKWLFRLASGLTDFTTYQARNVLVRLGFEPYHQERVAPTAVESPPADELGQREFLERVAAALPGFLPPQLRPSAMRIRGNHLRLVYPEFHIAHIHYELHLSRSRHEVALHLESETEINLTWLEHLKPVVSRLGDLAGHPLHAGRRGRKWASAGISLQPQALTPAYAQEAAALLARLIEALHPAVLEALARTPLPVAPTKNRQRRVREPREDTQRRYDLLDAEVRAIRDFLDGRAAGQPSDERLCYWVYLCLTLELYAEGWRLFALVDRSQVQRPLYDYTHRFAEACRMRAGI